MCDQQSLRSACAYAQSDQSLCLSLEYSMTVKLLTKHHLELLRLKGCCTGPYESTHVKKPHCWKSHDTAQISNSISVPAHASLVRFALSSNEGSGEVSHTQSKDIDQN